MRKQNSEFVTKFISEAGTQLMNSDYFAFVELDHYACYVLADGIDAANAQKNMAAKLAVHTIIASFIENPSMKKHRVRQYLQDANTALRLKNEMWSLKASLTLVITDYAKLRYAQAGNTRFRLYRNGYVRAESEDQSLSRMMVEEYKLSQDKVSEHEERNNLYTYLGQKDQNCRPYISPKIKLMDGDVISLHSRGIWERIPDFDLDEVFHEAGDDPQAILDQVEDLLLSPHPENLDCYTLAAIFVNKIYIDPNRKKRIRRIVTISIVVLVVVLVISLIVFFWLRHRRRQREEMDMAFTFAVEYMTDHNFVKAADELDTASELAKKLWDKQMQLRISNYQMLNEAVISGQEAMDAGNYETAEEQFLTARKRSRYADRLAETLIERRLSSIRDYIDVHNYLAIGDSFLSGSDYARAIEQYENARRLAASVNYAQGRDLALQALEDAAQEMSELNEEGKELAKEEIAAADFILQGDRALKDGDHDGAKLYYTMAREKYVSLGNDEMAASIDVKIEALQTKLDDYEGKMQQAENYMAQGEALKEQSDYYGAKQQYLLARAIYSAYAETKKADQVQELIEQMDNYIAEKNGRKQESK